MSRSSTGFSKRKRENESRSLLQGFVTGGGSTDDFLTQNEFLERGQRICYWIVRRTDFDGRELFGKAYIKTAELFNKVSDETAVPEEKPDLDEIRDEEEFCKWFFILARNIFRDDLRRIRRETSLFVDLSDRELTEADPSVNVESEYLVTEFLEFTKTLPAERRRAITLRREGYTYREVADILNSEGMGESPSHVTVRKWIKDSLEAFFDNDSEE